MAADYHKSPKAHLVKFHFKPAHGQSRTRTYLTWKGMVARCHCETHKDYPKYGGRGIFVCDEWRSWENFFSDMGHAPDGKSLDRIDNDGPYSKANCRWATLSEQGRNKRTNVRFEFNGLNLTLPEWSERTGIPWVTLKGRRQRKWSVEKMLTEPVK